MKILRLSVLSVFLVVLVIFVFSQFQLLGVDRTVPQITIADGILEVGLDVTTDDLLQGVTAYDEKDGDITDKIIVESISRFVKPGTSVVRYAVCDSNNHVASAARTIVYTNYVPPRFRMTDSLVFKISQNINIRSVLGAVDCIDGDISDRVIVTANEYTANIPAVYYISAKVSNSKGDMIVQQFPVYVEDSSLSAPEIELKEYIVYLAAGEEYDIMSNVLSAVGKDGTDLSGQIHVDTNLDTSAPGMYEVHYRAADSMGRTGHEILLVIVK